jgi:hypothetical protein
VKPWRDEARLVDVEGDGRVHPRWVVLVNRQTALAGLRTLIDQGAKQIGIMPFGAARYSDLVRELPLSANATDVGLHFFHIDAGDFADIYALFGQRGCAPGSRTANSHADER